MKDLQIILTEDLVIMLSKRTDAHLKLTKLVIQSSLDIIELKKLIDWRNLTATSLIPTIGKIVDEA